MALTLELLFFQQHNAALKQLLASTRLPPGVFIYATRIAAQLIDISKCFLIALVLARCGTDGIGFHTIGAWVHIHALTLLILHQEPDMLIALISEIIAVSETHIKAPILQIPLVVGSFHGDIQAACIRLDAGGKTYQFNGAVYVGGLLAEIIVLWNACRPKAISGCR